MPEPEPHLKIIFKHFKFSPKNAMLVEDGLRDNIKSTIDSGDDLDISAIRKFADLVEKLVGWVEKTGHLSRSSSVGS